MVFPHILYCHCNLLRGPPGIAADMVAPANGARLENRADDSHPHTQLVPVPSDDEIRGNHQRVLQAPGWIIECQTGESDRGHD